MTIDPFYMFHFPTDTSAENDDTCPEGWEIDETRDPHAWLKYHRTLCSDLQDACRVLASRTAVSAEALAAAVKDLEKAIYALESCEPEFSLHRHWRANDSSDDLDAAWENFFSLSNKVMMALSSIYRIVSITRFTSQNLRFLWEHLQHGSHYGLWRIQDVLHARERVLEQIRRYSAAIDMHADEHA